MSHSCVLVPCKPLALGKSRLSAYLSDGNRRDLCAFLLERTLQCVRELVSCKQIFVVTGDPEAAGIAEGQAARVIEDPGAGLNPALEDARHRIRRDRPEARTLVILPIDLPWLETPSLAQALANRSDVVIAADEGGTGTNLLILNGAAFGTVPFSYGLGSFAAHRAAAVERALAVHTIQDSRLAFDLDDPTQYARWLRQAWAPPRD